jgi:hypothetical protein
MKLAPSSSSIRRVAGDTSGEAATSLAVFDRLEHARVQAVQRGQHLRQAVGVEEAVAQHRVGFMGQLHSSFNEYLGPDLHGGCRP